MNSTNVLPGMLNDDVEIFVDGDKLKVIQSGKIIPFSEVSFVIIETLREAINQSIDVKAALHDMHPNSEMKRIEQFAICRFGGLDFTGDLVNGILQDGEYWPCPFHGTCEHEGTLCKLPKINNHRLTKEDVRLMQLTSSEMTNEVIASEMKLALGTFHLKKKILYSNLETMCKQTVARISTSLNLI
jgi:hypothetical protein